MSNKSSHQKTFKQKQAEIQALVSQMDQAVDSYFVDPEKLKQYLSFMSQFHRYSPANVALIEKQFPGAKAVGSFQFWKSKDYTVRKGEHGQKIWVPIQVPAKFQTKTGEWKPIRQATEAERIALEQGTLRQIEAHRGYTIGTVFDISQTTCPIEKLPELFPNRHITGEIKNFDLWTRGLRQVANTLGVTIDETRPYTFGAAKGVFLPKLNRIQLNPRNTSFENATVLTHELAHAALHPQDKRAKTTVREREFQAEMTAYVVHAHFGVDTQNESLHYLASWTKNKTLADKKKLIGEVHETSLNFITTLESELAKGKEEGRNMSEKLNQKPMKTLDQWEKGSLTDYLQIGDRVDDALKNHLMHVSPPRVNNEQVMQCGEPYGMKDGKNTFITFAKEDGEWIYKGACFAGEHQQTDTLSKTEGAPVYSLPTRPLKPAGLSKSTSLTRSR